MAEQLVAGSPTKTPTKKVPAWSLYKKLSQIGAGAYGQVFIAESIPEANHGVTGQYVIKRIFLDVSEDIIRSAAMEVKILQTIPAHDNIVRYFDHFVDDESHINIVMEYCPYGDLAKYIQGRKKANVPFTLQEVLFLAFQLLVGVRHLHAHGVMHRDLKPENLFLTSGPPPTESPALSPSTTPQGRTLLHPSEEDEWEDTGGFSGTGGTASPYSEGDEVDEDGKQKKKKKKHRDHHHKHHHRKKQNFDFPELPLEKSACCHMSLKIADFGISKIVQHTASMAQTVIGTPHYISPEICEAKPYTLSADMWAIGCIIYELASFGEKCFAGANMLAIVKKITSGSFEPLKDPKISASISPLLKVLIQVDPAKRLSAEQCITTFFQPEKGDEEYADDFEDPDE